MSRELLMKQNHLPVNYYESSYDGSYCGLKRYFKNFAKQSCLVKTNVIVAFGMAAIEVFEFLATFQILVLISTTDYNFILAWTLWTYFFLFVFKFFDLLWLVFGQWESY